MLVYPLAGAVLFLTALIQRAICEFRLVGPLGTEAPSSAARLSAPLGLFIGVMALSTLLATFTSAAMLGALGALVLVAFAVLVIGFARGRSAL